MKSSSTKRAIKISLLIFVLFAFVNVNFIDAYVSVGGYFRSNGTYVVPYVRSSPNALKYDNYSWTPSQGLYNPSYYAPTKNYSSDWYAPSYITDPEYYIGKILYESGQSGSGGIVGSGTGTGTGVNFPVVPIVPTSPKTNITCGVNEYLSTFSNTCYCNSGYKRNSAGVCEKVVCGVNEYLSTFSNTCYCNTGYKKNSSGVCEKVICGVNEYFSTFSNTCYCSPGYKKNNAGICEKIICGANEYLSTFSDTCYCNSGYKKNAPTGQCEQIIVPPNAHFNSWFVQGWYCDTGYKQVGNSCQPE